ncbi:TPA: hypothetical protein IAA87_05775 [Candidatus Avigastranaerophilus faecigallinarum]|nr:hypothetical protein [Candidatus Avigastranaerophilus faecigallinarum]
MSYIVKNCPAYWGNSFFSCHGREQNILNNCNCEEHKNCITKQTIEDLKKIITDDDSPACYENDDCPINGGYGFDNHCNMNCPLLIAKLALKKWEIAEC